MKILHISDLHIVSGDTLAHALEFQKSLKKIGIDFPLSVSTIEDRNRLLAYLQTNHTEDASRFDAIIFSGDATSIGDTSSMKEAKVFITQIAEMVLPANQHSKCFVIPGNHDALAYGIKALLDQFNSKAGYAGGFLMKAVGLVMDKVEKADIFKAALEKFLGQLNISTIDRNDETFRNLVRQEFMTIFDPYTCYPIGDKTILKPIDGECANGDKVRLNICTLNTSATHPIFVNMGTVADEHLVNIVNHEDLMKEVPDGHEVVNFAVSHHGLMALSSDTVVASATSGINLTAFLEHAITSQLNGFKLGQALQRAGYDIHLHGHEHQTTLIRYDFDVDHYGSIYSSGVKAAFGSDISFSVIELPSPHCMTIENFSYSGAAFTSTKSDVVFDHLKSPKNSELAKAEIRQFYYMDTEDVGPSANVSKDSFMAACDKLLLESEKGMFVFGVSLDTLRNHMLEISDAHEYTEKAKRLRTRINLGIDVLIVKPNEGDRAYEVYDEKTIIAELEELRNNWAGFFEELGSNMAMAPEILKKKIRVSHTTAPLGHAGNCEYVDTGNRGMPRFSKALIQTVRISAAYDTDVYLELDNRTNKGLLRHFAGSAWNLKRLGKRLFETEN